MPHLCNAQNKIIHVFTIFVVILVLRGTEREKERGAESERGSDRRERERERMSAKNVRKPSLNFDM